jgi:hypothetical protein
MRFLPGFSIFWSIESIRLPLPRRIIGFVDDATKEQLPVSPILLALYPREKTNSHPSVPIATASQGNSACDWPSERSVHRDRVAPIPLLQT